MTRRSLLLVLATAGLIAPVALTAQSAPTADELRQVPRVSLADFKRLHAKKAVLAIDVRDPHGYDAGHIPGALNLSIVDIEIMGNRILKESRPVVAYCACPDEHSSLVVAARLRRIGAKDIRVLVGGWDAWKAGGGKVEVTPAS